MRQIFEGCGEPKLRRRRQAGGDAPSYDATDFKRVQLQSYADDRMDAEPSPLLRVLGQIRSQVSCPAVRRAGTGSGRHRTAIYSATL